MKKLYFFIGVEGSGHYMLRDVLSDFVTNSEYTSPELIYDLKNSHPTLCNFLHYLKTPNHIENKQSDFRYTEFYSYDEGINEFSTLLTEYNSFILDYSFPFNMDKTRFFDYPSLSAVYEFMSNFSDLEIEVAFLNRDLAEACKSTIRRGHGRGNDIISAYTMHFSYLEVLNNKYFAKTKEINFINLEFEKLINKDKNEFLKLENFLNISLKDSDLNKIKSVNSYGSKYNMIDKFFSQNLYPEI